MNLYIVGTRLGHYVPAVFSTKAEAIKWANGNSYAFVDRITVNRPDDDENVWERPA